MELLAGKYGWTRSQVLEDLTAEEAVLYYARLLGRLEAEAEAQEKAMGHRRGAGASGAWGGRPPARQKMEWGELLGSGMFGRVETSADGRN